MLFLLLTLQYDGYDYSGWVKQKKAKTIQGELENALFRLCKLNVWTLGASKTDAGVHALGQKALVNLPFIPRNLDFFIITLSESLPLNIIIKDYQIVTSEFNVRNTNQKKYVYTINDQKSDILTYRYELKIKTILDTTILQQIAKIFIGEYDFRYFSGVKKDETIKTIRKINNIVVIRNGVGKIEFHFYAKSFIRYQIRMIVENILACYHKKISVAQLQEFLARPPIGEKTKYCAKPYGLCLMNIIY